jgi:cytochrome c oxidase subunit II
MSGARQAIRLTSRVGWLLVAAGLSLLSGCKGPQRVLAPEGPGARELADLWWVLLWGTALPAALTLGIIIAAVLRGRRANKQVEPPSRGEEAFILGVGGVLTGLILLGLLLASFRAGNAAVRPPSEPAVTVHVTGHQFWWEVSYPEHGVVDANELYLPAGQPVRVVLSSGDVIHSFWVPQLHGKLDMLPGRTHRYWLQADRPGVYRGQCAEFCGIQHALMAFFVEAEPPEAFAARMARMREAARARASGGGTPGEAVFVQAGCGLCHAVGGRKGEGATGAPGPDLTHVASRRTLAAGTLPNTRDTLREWILRPQALKPGNRMPPTPLAPEQLEALLDYLETLD